MRTLLLITPLMMVIVRGGEAGAPTMREKLHARIMESIPPPPPPKPAADPKDGQEPVTPVLVMKPVIVAESKLVREVAAAIARAEQNRQDERFSALDGGTIYSFGRTEIGGWWSPNVGWTFLRTNKGPTQRQADATEAMLKELQELAHVGEPRPLPPPPKPYGTELPRWRGTSTDR